MSGERKEQPPERLASYRAARPARTAPGRPVIALSYLTLPHPRVQRARLCI